MEIKSKGLIMKTLQLATAVALLLSSITSVMAYDDNYQEDSLMQTVISEPININNASIEQLILLKGIGKKKAQAIVTYREENGAFITVDDLVNVKGIGDKIIEVNRSLLTI